jgi:hypothetical protein
MDRQTMRVAMMAGSLVALLMGLMTGFSAARSAVTDHYFDPLSWLLPILLLVAAGVLTRFVPKA